MLPSTVEAHDVPRVRTLPLFQTRGKRAGDVAEAEANGVEDPALELRVRRFRFRNREIPANLLETFRGSRGFGFPFRGRTLIRSRFLGVFRLPPARVRVPPSVRACFWLSRCSRGAMGLRWSRSSPSGEEVGGRLPGDTRRVEVVAKHVGRAIAGCSPKGLPAGACTRYAVTLDGGCPATPRPVVCCVRVVGGRSPCP